MNCLVDYKRRKDAMLKKRDEADWMKYGLLHEEVIS
jgi:hypothetical protein